MLTGDEGWIRDVLRTIGAFEPIVVGYRISHEGIFAVVLISRSIEYFSLASAEWAEALCPFVCYISFIYHRSSTYYNKARVQSVLVLASTPRDASPPTTAGPRA